MRFMRIAALLLLLGAVAFGGLSQLSAQQAQEKPPRNLLRRPPPSRPTKPTPSPRTRKRASPR